METLYQDITYAVRSLRKRLGFTFIVILTLAFGIGATVAVFTFINATLLKPLPFPNEDRLVFLTETSAENRQDTGVSYLNFTDWRRNCRLFESMSLVAHGTTATWQAADEEAMQSYGAFVSGEYFGTLGVQAMIGRAFEPSEEFISPEATPPLVLSHLGWKKLCRADPSIIGRIVSVNERKMRIIGVAPPEMFPIQQESVDFWSPAGIVDGNSSRGYRPYLGVMARLRPNVTLAQANAEIEAVRRQLTEQNPKTNAGLSLEAMTLRNFFIGDARQTLRLAFGVVFATLLIACVNVANLLLMRTASQTREIAIRAALGASWRRIAQRLLTESLLLSIMGGVVGAILSVWLVHGFITFTPSNIPHLSNVSPDFRVWAFASVVTLLTGVVCGIFPIISLHRKNLAANVRESAPSMAGNAKTAHLRSVLVISEIASAMLLLTCAGLLLNSLFRLHQSNPGFTTQGVLTFQMSLSGKRYSEPNMNPVKINAFLDSLTVRLKALPGATSISYAQNVPLIGNENNTEFSVADRPVDKERKIAAQLRFIGNAYLTTLNIPLRAGRDFTDRDGPNSPPVMLVNEAFVREHFNGKNPVGNKLQLGWGGEVPKEIVGIVGDVRHRSLSDTPRPEMYVPQSQFGNGDVTALVRSTIPPETLINAVKSEIRALDPTLPVMNIRSLTQYRDDALAYPRCIAFLLAGFALIAILLTSVGLYGVVSYGVAQQTQEIGVRRALGAQTSDIFRLVLGRGAKIIFTGVGVGLAGSFIVNRSIKNLLFGITTTDPVTFAAVTLILLIVAFFACYFPARRAAQVDPMTALRHE